MSVILKSHLQYLVKKYNSNILFSWLAYGFNILKLFLKSFINTKWQVHDVTEYGCWLLYLIWCEGIRTIFSPYFVKYKRERKRTNLVKGYAWLHLFLFQARFGFTQGASCVMGRYFGGISRVLQHEMGVNFSDQNKFEKKNQRKKSKCPLTMNKNTWRFVVGALVRMPPLMPASIWTKKETRGFKDMVKKNPENVIKIGSLATATVSWWGLRSVGGTKCCLVVFVVVEDFPPISAASMWNRKDVKDFKQMISKEPESVIKVGSGETVTVSMRLLTPCTSVLALHPPPLSSPAASKQIALYVISNICPIIWHISRHFYNGCGACLA